MTYSVVWNEARTYGFITDEHQLAYEMRKGACNPLGIVSIDFIEAWNTMTADDNCTIDRADESDIRNAVKEYFIGIQHLSEVDPEDIVKLIARFAVFAQVPSPEPVAVKSSIPAKLAVWQNDGELRWMDKAPGRFLQQKWVNIMDGEIQWREIPVVAP